MRLLIDTLIALMAVGLLGGVLWTRSGEADVQKNIDNVREALEELRITAAYHGALGHLSNSPAGYPVHMMPEWFPEPRPANALLSEQHPWIDLAPPGDHAIHPPDPVAFRKHQAGFWYNPNLGVFRARVPADGSDASRLELYNRINHADLAALPQSENGDRTPQAYHPSAAFTAHASHYAPSGRVEGRATDPDGDGVLVIEWVSGDPAQLPATIHELPDRWTVPEKRHEDAESEEPAAPDNEGENPAADATADAPADTSGEEPAAVRDNPNASSDSTGDARAGGRPTLGDLSPDENSP
jgi:hypothetical protein